MFTLPPREPLWFEMTCLIEFNRCLASKRHLLMFSALCGETVGVPDWERGEVPVQDLSTSAADLNQRDEKVTLCAFWVWVKVLGAALLCFCLMSNRWLSKVTWHFFVQCRNTATKLSSVRDYCAHSTWSFSDFYFLCDVQFFCFVWFCQNRKIFQYVFFSDLWTWNFPSKKRKAQIISTERKSQSPDS